MRKFFVIPFFWTIACAQSLQSITDLSWITGEWEMIKGETRIEEIWLAPAGNMMMGMSRTVRNGTTLEYEFLTIEQDSLGNIVYHARPSRQAHASFRLTKEDSLLLQFENSDHDFPQRIIYNRISDDSLAARIEGTINAKKRTVEFRYGKKRR